MASLAAFPLNISEYADILLQMFSGSFEICSVIFLLLNPASVLLFLSLLRLAGEPGDGAFWIPFCQQLSSKNSSLLPTWSSCWGSRRSNQGWKFHLPLVSILQLGLVPSSYWPEFEQALMEMVLRWQPNINARLVPQNSSKNAGIFWILLCYFSPPQQTPVTLWGRNTEICWYLHHLHSNFL